jgi:hypothetical protein
MRSLMSIMTMAFYRVFLRGEGTLFEEWRRARASTLASAVYYSSTVPDGDQTFTQMRVNSIAGQATVDV